LQTNIRHNDENEREQHAIRPISATPTGCQHEQDEARRQEEFEGATFQTQCSKGNISPEEEQARSFFVCSSWLPRTSFCFCLSDLSMFPFCHSTTTQKALGRNRPTIHRRRKGSEQASSSLIVACCLLSVVALLPSTIVVLFQSSLVSFLLVPSFSLISGMKLPWLPRLLWSRKQLLN
jgi:hypothetical protein